MIFLEGKMSRQRLPFTVVRQHQKYWFIRYYDDQGVRRTIASGCTTKAAALRKAAEWYRAGILSGNSQGTMTFMEYSTNWWSWDRCAYIKSEALHGRILSRQYCNTNRL